MISVTCEEVADLVTALDDRGFVMLVSFVVARIVDERGGEFARAFLGKAIDGAIEGVHLLDAPKKDLHE